MQILQSHPELDALGLRGLEKIYWQFHTPQLYEQAVRRYEGMVAHLGPLVVRTGNLTHHAARDSFIVRESSTQHDIAWGENHRAMEPDAFDRLFERMLSYLNGKTIFVQNVFAGADEDYRMPFRIITETAWHNLFARNMFFAPSAEDMDDFLPEFTLIHAGNFRAIPEEHGTSSSVFLVVNFARRLILIGGTNYAGEIKKAVSSVLNYLLPQQGLLPMRCASSVGKAGDVALFFGRSETGKTALASGDPDRLLVGDDQHVWTNGGIFTIERGGYANIINISPKLEPAVYETTRRFGTILENVAIDVSNRRLDLGNDAFTDNTRACYPLTHLPNVVQSGKAGIPRNIIFLVRDVFGVLPPVAHLDHDQPAYYFRLGYNGRLVNNKPIASFSGCFDEPSLPLHPGTYASLFNKLVETHKIPVWLVNSGWAGGPPADGGQRIKLAHTRTIVNAIVNGTLEESERWTEPIFGFSIPKECPDVFEGVLDPRESWKNKDAYEQAAQALIQKFRTAVEARAAG